MLRRIFNKKNFWGQSAAELAIFGAVVIFVVGAIVKAGVGATQAMNSRLRAFRMALAESYKTSECQYHGPPATKNFACDARNNASILLIEDRLTVDASKKYGNRDRSIAMSSGNATLSKNLFYFTDWYHPDEYHNLPVYDVIINGQRFPFTVADVKRMKIAIYEESYEYPAPFKINPPPPPPDKVLGHGINQVIIRPGEVDYFPSGSQSCLTPAGWRDAPSGPDDVCYECPDFTAGYNPPEEPTRMQRDRYCIKITELRGVTGNEILRRYFVPICPNHNPAFPQGICWQPGCYYYVKPPIRFAYYTPPVALADEGPKGCLMMVKRVGNYPNSEKWCPGTDKDGVITECDSNLKADDRFDLDFDGKTDVEIGTKDPTGVELRTMFNWQWVRAAAAKHEAFSGRDNATHRPMYNITGPGWVPTDPADYSLGGTIGPGSRKVDWLYFGVRKDGIPSKNTIADVDGDLKHEVISSALAKGQQNPYAYTLFVVKDDQEGDIDTSGFADKDARRIGLGQDMGMTSYTKDGTYLKIEEGKLYSYDGNYVRETTSSDHVDWITRRFGITNNTGRFCSKDGKPRGWKKAGIPTNFSIKIGVRGLDNPVEACALEDIGTDCDCIYTPADPGVNCGDNDNDYIPNIQQTCLEMDSDPGVEGDQPLIHVRSRIVDRRIRRWVTKNP